jgi:hypothetical protein
LPVIAVGDAARFGTATEFVKVFIARAMIGPGVAAALIAGLKAVVMI